MNKENKKIRKEEVIAKLKDDGDFDKLRLKIILKLKDNVQLHNNIISAVKQSAALNRLGSENMKVRQLSNAIHDEVWNKMIGQISDSLWEIIRSEGSTRTEITEIVVSHRNNNKTFENSQGRDVKIETHQKYPIPNK
uniref:Uncharacterized protein n=1 Tax=Gossypium raimondii TaxID=29730 RepID=A0A0D2TS72_GOSRA|nr:hypothetical protein B456_013G043900 [Gossypium raimondii]